MNMYENIKSSIKESDNNVVEKMCSFIGDLFKNEAEGFTTNSESLYDWCEGGDAFHNAGYDEDTCNKLNKLLMEINPIVQELNGKLFDFYGTLNESTDGELEKLKNELRYRAIDLYGDGDISSEVTNEDIDKIANKIKSSGFFISNDIFTDDNDEYEWQKINDFLDDEIRKYKNSVNESEENIPGARDLYVKAMATYIKSAIMDDKDMINPDEDPESLEYLNSLTDTDINNIANKIIDSYSFEYEFPNTVLEEVYNYKGNKSNMED